MYAFLSQSQHPQSFPSSRCSRDRQTKIPCVSQRNQMSQAKDPASEEPHSNEEDQSIASHHSKNRGRWHPRNPAGMRKDEQMAGAQEDALRTQTSLTRDNPATGKPRCPIGKLPRQTLSPSRNDKKELLSPTPKRIPQPGNQPIPPKRPSLEVEMLPPSHTNSYIQIKKRLYRWSNLEPRTNSLKATHMSPEQNSGTRRRTSQGSVTSRSSSDEEDAAEADKSSKAEETAKEVSKELPTPLSKLRQIKAKGGK
ncbi:uncharacterized protein G2W53_008007 [Senna tora]|uniref:Uncharacterized protein n=1 Tax=Senna tora TaxID=362788 RepID=A0A834X7Q3_9FABA|nr:uncharacterized protein G2W53_008007 [Senna tora]